MSIDRVALAPDYTISRIIKGGWQLAGGHGPIARERALADMRAFVDAGITTFDCADIYTGVEALIGEFLGALPPSLRQGIRVHTKYVPDRAALPTLTAPAIAAAIEGSLRRLRVEALDLVQFHWWDYAIPGYVDAALVLTRLKETGKIRQIGVTNFDVPRLGEILAAGVPVVSHQVQCSLIDQRPLGAMRDLCREHAIALLAYGSLAGGFLSDRYLGAPEHGGALANRSLVKYRLVINEFGGWRLFQSLLQVLHAVARRHETSIGAVAVAYTLQLPQVAAAIVGATRAAHLERTVQAAALALQPEDLAAIEDVRACATGPHGDVYTLEREAGGPHARIMKDDLNAAREATALPGPVRRSGTDR